MNLSDKGLDFIVSFENKLTKMADGRYIAYRCPANKPTIYAGCTEGVFDGMICTEDEGKAMFAKEIGKHEAAVRRLVTVDIDQQQFDALVSFSYNAGEGALKTSTLLKHLNTGDYARAASHFADYKKARVYGKLAKKMGVADGTKVTLPGLVRRRAAEAALFLTNVSHGEMAQKVEQPDTKMKPMEAAAKVGVPALAGAEVVRKTIPDVPEVVTKSISNAGAWKSAGQSVLDLTGNKLMLPVAVAIGCFLVVKYVLPKVVRS